MWEVSELTPGQNEASEVAPSLCCGHREHLVHKEEHAHCRGGEAQRAKLLRMRVGEEPHTPTSPLPQGLTDGATSGPSAEETTVSTNRHCAGSQRAHTWNSL